MDTLLEQLKRYAASGALPMHMPGHKRNTAAFPWLAELGGALDITEIDGFDNLNDPRGLFRDLEARAARLWGARESVCLVNGSTAGVLSAVRSSLERGGSLLLFRGCHKSVYHAAELVGAETYYLTPEIDRALGVWGSVTPEAVPAALEAHPDVRLVAVTSPTYEGVISDIRSIAAACHARGVPLLVDEAHGAHLGFSGFPESAVACGADLVVQSLHKTLSSLTQTAVLHICGNLVDPADVRRNAAMFQSSSPSYLLSASIAGCVDFLEREGGAAADRWLELLAHFRENVRELRRIRLWDGGSAFAFDQSKLVLSAEGLTGEALMDILRERFGIELEMAAGRYALAMTGIGDTEETLSRLAEALVQLDNVCETASPSFPVQDFSLPEKRLSIRAALAAPGAFFPAKEALGQVSGEYLWRYPPGAPLLVPGEVVDEGVLRELGGNLRSTRGGAPERIFCVTEY